MLSSHGHTISSHQFLIYRDVWLFLTYSVRTNIKTREFSSIKGIPTCISPTWQWKKVKCFISVFSLNSKESCSVIQTVTLTTTISKARNHSSSETEPEDCNNVKWKANTRLHTGLGLCYAKELQLNGTDPGKFRTHFLCFFNKVCFQHVFCTFGVDKSVCRVQSLSLIHPPCSFFDISSMLKEKKAN